MIIVVCVYQVESTLASFISNNHDTKMSIMKFQSTNLYMYMMGLVFASDSHRRARKLKAFDSLEVAALHSAHL